MSKNTIFVLARNSSLILVASVACFFQSGRVLGQTSAPDDGSVSDTATGSSSVIGTQNSSGGFFSRLGKAYWIDWTGTQEESATPARRGFPAPVTSPPFPFSDWPYGGSPVIGAPDTSGGPLMTAIYGSKHGKSWENSRIKMYGWVNSGFNLSTSDKHYGNAPAAYYIEPNSIQLDQAAFYIERVPDTVQKDHFDWGFRLTRLYGNDSQGLPQPATPVEK